MGWYDAFRGNVARVNTSAATSDSGSGVKNLGDAFSSIGKSILDVEDAREVSALRDKQKEKTDSGIALDQYNLESKKAEDDYTKQEREQKTFDDAFSKDFMSTQTKSEWDEKKSSQDYKPSAQALEKEQQYFQNKFNDEAVTTSVAGGYKDFKEFSAANPELIKNADGITLTKIEKWYGDKDTTLLSIEAKKKELKHQEELSKKEAKIAKLNSKSTEGSQKLNKDLLDLQNSIAKEYGQYDDATGMYVIDPDKKEAAQVALNYGTELLNNGVKSLSQIRKMTQENFSKKKEQADNKDPLGLGI